jgi:hypothetical protein
MAYRVFFDGVPDVRLTEAPAIPDVPTKLVIPGFALCHRFPKPCGGLTREHDEATALVEAVAKANGLRLASVARTQNDTWTAMLTSKRKLRPESANCYLPVATVVFRVSTRRGVGE